MSKPLLAAGLLVAMAGAWYWALLPAGPSVPSPSAAARHAAGGPSAAVPAVRLWHLATAEAARPAPAEGRNPFAGGPGRSAPQDGRPAPAAVAVADPVAPVADVPAPAWPRLELIGVAEGRVGGALVRTAIVSGPHGVQHARAGDVIEQVYRVERIGADGVDLRLVPEDRTLRLALRP